MILLFYFKDALNSFTRAGAAGTALCVTVMNIGQRNYQAKVVTSGVSEKTNALIAGMQFAYKLGFVIAVMGLVLSLFVRRGSQSE